MDDLRSANSVNGSLKRMATKVVSKMKQIYGKAGQSVKKI
jgi:hypothetical protein